MRVPAGEPVGADAALERRDACHQRDEDDDAVAGEQAGDPAGVGQPVAEAVDRRGVVPPQRDRRDRAGEDDGEDGVRVRAPTGGAGRAAAARLRSRDAGRRVSVAAVTARRIRRAPCGR